MKKLFVLLCAVIVCIMLTGCFTERKTREDTTVEIWLPDGSYSKTERVEIDGEIVSSHSYTRK